MCACAWSSLVVVVGRYITAISTVRYRHRNHPADPAPGSGHVSQPITLGQLEIPDLIGYQANFSVVR